MTGSQVETMAPLVKLEPLGGDEEADSAAPAHIDLPAPLHDADAKARCDRLRAELCAILMGFDTDPSRRVLDEYLAAREDVLAEGGDVLTGETAFIGLFADLAELSRNRPFGEQDHTELRIHSDREHLHRYLTTLDVDRAKLPGQFVDRLGRVLRHYGVESLDRTPQLEAAVFRIFLAQKRVAADVPLVLGILDRWMTGPAPTPRAPTPRGPTSSACCARPSCAFPPSAT
ncbi:hypothetical protein [Tessaracoccus coleopterorum]|uniref:hypothetical protein n=1 Tax=Tessaracoccus coleopterorum TaxID=2714950 RepID=UPI001E428005|nr:hypothetical protein [Tessaracoccus coleopterorum]